ncbi:unnamed protein product [Amoebophrya sp. A25]|nr:unnamed protein product [Amoebophrya sp. A25]|eukprot:GSA25T00023382001.1
MLRLLLLVQSPFRGTELVRASVGGVDSYRQAGSSTLWPQPAQVSCVPGSDSAWTGPSQTIDAAFDLRTSEAHPPSAADVQDLRQFIEHESSYLFIHADTRTRQGGFLLELEKPRASPSVWCEGGGESCYRLRIDKGRAWLGATDYSGLLYAFVTLAQFLRFDPKNEVYLMPQDCTVKDGPRFQHRGLLIDTGRHFLPTPFIERLVRAMAWNKLNVLHWHISDDQSFPAMLPDLPELALAGAFDNVNERYSVGEVRRIVRYARRHAVTVVPEVNMPGHSSAIRRSHPGLFACGGQDTSAKEVRGVLSGNLEETYEFVGRLLASMSRSFPGERFHFGSEEAPAACFSGRDMHGDSAKAYTKFVARLAEMSQRVGKRPIFYDEAAQYANVTRRAIIQVWKGPDRLRSLVRAGYDVIYSSLDTTYLNMDTPWQKMYAQDPIPNGLSMSERNRVLGGEALAWGEHLDASNVESTIFPRASILAELFWSPPKMGPRRATLGRLVAWRCQMLSLGIQAEAVGYSGMRLPLGPGPCWQSGDFPSEHGQPHLIVEHGTDRIDLDGDGRVEAAAGTVLQTLEKQLMPWETASFLKRQRLGLNSLLAKPSAAARKPLRQCVSAECQTKAFCRSRKRIGLGTTAGTYLAALSLVWAAVCLVARSCPADRVKRAPMLAWSRA